MAVVLFWASVLVVVAAVLGAAWFYDRRTKARMNPEDGTMQSDIGIATIGATLRRMERDAGRL